MKSYWMYLAVMTIVTYLVRAVPFVLIRRRIKSRFINSLLTYIPYAILSAMTFPAILYSTGSLTASLVATVVALILSYTGRSLLTVSLSAVGAALVMGLIF